jgi:hypothetical protein
VRRARSRSRSINECTQKIEALGAMRLAGIPDQDPQLSLILQLNSLFAPKNSLLGLQKFPVPLRREILAASH